MAAPKGETSGKITEYKLEEDQELRFEVCLLVEYKLHINCVQVAANGELTVELVNGKCEMFGTEIVHHKKCVCLICLLHALCINAGMCFRLARVVLSSPGMVAHWS